MRDLGLAASSNTDGSVDVFVLKRGKVKKAANLTPRLMSSFLGMLITASKEAAELNGHALSSEPEYDPDDLVGVEPTRLGLDYGPEQPTLLVLQAGMVHLGLAVQCPEELGKALLTAAPDPSAKLPDRRGVLREGGARPRKRPTQQDDPKKETWPGSHLKVISPDFPHPSASDKRKIIRAIEKGYDETTMNYRRDVSDRSVAEHLQMPQQWVTDVREEFFGSLPDGVVSELLAELEQFRRELALVRSTAESVINDTGALENRATLLLRKADEITRSLRT